MKRKRLLWLLGFGLLFAAVLLWKSPQGRLESDLGELASALSYTSTEGSAARASRFRGVMTRWLDESTQVQIAGGGSYVGVDANLQALEGLAASRPQLFFEVERVEVTLQGDQASAVGLLNVSATQVGDLHRDQRRIDLGLIKRGDGWKVQRLVIGEADNTQPWERP
ncbi:MAG: hypothetical protein H6718_16180 [Polyangiaceae bacterium]|nr:hypothetical protein [Myxococcales bacterium]MCB9586937.1 hypothetical protein [Polyangiaceae bacterium]MCB9608226.1 hypothetical protein [Polyangiaceae bacterium]